MQVQAIQSTNQNNNVFKARFIDDKNGYFRKLWQDALINESFHYLIEIIIIHIS